MTTDRRGFFGALVAVALAPFLKTVPRPGWNSDGRYWTDRIYSCGPVDFDKEYDFVAIDGKIYAAKKNSGTANFYLNGKFLRHVTL